jgi:hypothetical protein
MSEPADDDRVAPPDGPSGEKRSRQPESPPKLEPDSSPAARWPQFAVSDILMVMVGAAVGLAGGTWMPADIFAAVLGLVTLLGLLVVHLFPPQTRLGKRLWATLVLAYITAVGAALFRSGG